MAKKFKQELWIKNISKKSITLNDLSLTLPSNCSLNLLRLRYPISEIQKSIDSGSISKNYRNLILTEKIQKNLNIEPKTIFNGCSPSTIKSVIDKEEIENDNVMFDIDD